MPEVARSHSALRFAVWLLFFLLWEAAITGAVLIALLAQAEIPYEHEIRTHIWDPASETWSETGPLQRRRSVETLELRPDGRVLTDVGQVNELADGSQFVSYTDGGGDPEVRAELYDPTDGSWRLAGEGEAAPWPRPELPQPPDAPYLELRHLQDGRLFGVETDRSNARRIWLQRAGAWQATPTTVPAQEDIYTMQAVGVGGEGVLILWQEPTLHCQHFQPSAGALSDLQLPGVREEASWFSLTGLADGRALLVSGSILEAAAGQAWVFDPVQRSWSASEPIPGGRNHFASILLDDGRVLAVGGYGHDTGSYSDPTGRTWKLGGIAGAALLVLLLVAMLWKWKPQPATAVAAFLVAAPVVLAAVYLLAAVLAASVWR